MEYLHQGHEGAWLLLDHLETEIPALATSEEFWIALHDKGLVGPALYTFFLVECSMDMTTFRDRVISLVVRKFFRAVREPPPKMIPEKRTPSPTSVVGPGDWVFATP